MPYGTHNGDVVRINVGRLGYAESVLRAECSVSPAVNRSFDLRESYSRVLDEVASVMVNWRPLPPNRTKPTRSFTQPIVFTQSWLCQSQSLSAACDAPLFRNGNSSLQQPYINHGPDRLCLSCESRRCWRLLPASNRGVVNPSTLQGQ